MIQFHFSAMYDQLSENVRIRLRTLQMLVGALMLGMVTFGVVAFVSSMNAAPVPAAQVSILRLAAVGVLVSGGVAGFVLRGTAGRIGAKFAEGDEVTPERAMNWYFSSTIISVALLEGPALFLIVIHLISHDPLDLYLVGIPLVLIALVHLPTDQRFRNYLDSTKDALIRRP